MPLERIPLTSLQFKNAAAAQGKALRAWENAADKLVDSLRKHHGVALVQLDGPSDAELTTVRQSVAYSAKDLASLFLAQI